MSANNLLAYTCVKVDLHADGAAAKKKSTRDTNTGLGMPFSFLIGHFSLSLPLLRTDWKCEKGEKRVDNE